MNETKSGEVKNDKSLGGDKQDKQGDRQIQGDRQVERQGEKQGEKTPPVPRQSLPTLRTKSLRSARGKEPTKLTQLDPEGRTWLVPHVPAGGRTVEVYPGQSATLSTGLSVEVPEGYVLTVGHYVSSGRPGEVGISHFLTRPAKVDGIPRELLVRVTNTTQERIAFPAGAPLGMCWLTRGAAAAVEAE